MKGEDYNLETVSTPNPKLYGTISIGLSRNCEPQTPIDVENIRRGSRRESVAERTVNFLTTLRSTLMPNRVKYYRGAAPIPRYHPLKRLFDIYMLILVQYSVISSLYFLGYEKPEGNLLDFDYFVWACFILDFLLKFITQTSSKGKLIPDYRGIFLKYLRTWLFFDILSLLPLHFSNHPNAEYWLRMFRVFKMPKLIVMIRMKDLIDTMVAYMNISDHRSAKKLVIILNFAWNLVYQILGMLFTSYALACIWSYYTKIVEEYRDEDNSFQANYNLELLTNGERLIKTWYFIYTTLMTVGYGDLSATNKYEMGFCILLLIIAPSMYAYSMGKSIDTINRLQNAGKEDERYAESDVWLSSIELNYEKLRPKLKQRIIEHFSFYFQNDKARVLAEKHWELEDKESFITYHNSFLNSIPDQLRYKILDHLFMETFYRFKVFFGDQDDFRYYVCLHIQPRTYRKRACIIKEGSIPSEIFFMESGLINVGLKKDSEFTSLYEYRNKSIFGDYFVLFNSPSCARYIVKKRANGFALPGKVIKKVGKAFPNQLTLIKNLAEKKASIIKRTITEYLGNENYELDENKIKKINSITKPNKLSTKMVKGRQSFRAQKNETELLKDLPKILNNSKRSMNNLVCEVKDKLDQLISLKKESN